MKVAAVDAAQIKRGQQGIEVFEPMCPFGQDVGGEADLPLGGHIRRTVAHFMAPDINRADPGLDHPSMPSTMSLSGERGGLPGTRFVQQSPKAGIIVHLEAYQAAFREAVAATLVQELGLTYRAVKTTMRWTAASERAVKYWLSGERSPSGENLIALAGYSDSVLLVVLALAGRLVEDDVADR